jgi:hypothetical protein
MRSTAVTGVQPKGPGRYTCKVRMKYCDLPGVSVYSDSEKKLKITGSGSPKMRSNIMQMLSLRTNCCLAHCNMDNALPASRCMGFNFNAAPDYFYGKITY